MLGNIWNDVRHGTRMLARNPGFANGTGFRNPRLSAAEYMDIRDRSQSFDGVVAYTIAPASFAVSREQTAQRKVGMAVSGNLFDVMGVRPAYGRAFRADEDQTGRPVQVVVLDHGHDADRRASAGVGDAVRDLRAGAPRRAHRSSGGAATGVM